MKFLYIGIASLLIAGLLYSCQDKERDLRLQQKEQELLAKEKELKALESDYKRLLRLSDSLYAQRVDTIPAIPEEYLGRWNGKMVCTESDCPDHAVGDQRSDVWEITTDGKRVQSRVYDKEKLIRVYNGTYGDEGLKLKYVSDSTAKRQTEMTILLNEFKEGRIRGTRKISTDGCKAVYSVDLNRS